ncbi:MAG: DegT/DnrJ/EryC1/StrS family aminotransferase [Candidatus Woesearchaeota archaeon]|nr:DegT/DnrJ/EryC1/StrS family aminotransferase [Candidatus Woesearchaeota archaeon]
MIPLSKPHITPADIRGVVQVLKSGQLSMGTKTEQFERQFAGRIGTAHALAVNSGTSGLHLALRACGIGERDEVITTPFSFVASANCILFEKAKPVFVDVDEETFNLNPALVKNAITEKTKALLPVHIFGQSCAMDELMAIARSHHLKVIEDACEALDATYHGKKVGTFGDAAVFAFYPNKQMTTGEGGMVVTNDAAIAELCNSMRNQGRDVKNMQWLTHHRLGYNYRMTEMSAALGCSQLAKLDMLLAKRIRIAQKYLKKLKTISGIILPKTAQGNTHTWFVFPVRVADGISRDKVIEGLHARGVASKAYFSPCIHLQPFYKTFGFKEGDFPIAEKISRTTLILPLYAQMTEKDINTVVAALTASIAEARQQDVPNVPQDVPGAV